MTLDVLRNHIKKKGVGELLQPLLSPTLFVKYIKRPSSLFFNMYIKYM